MSIQLILERDRPDLFSTYWQEILNQYRPSPRYLLTSLAAYPLTAKEKGVDYVNASFVYLVNNKPLAGVFLPIEKSAEVCAVSCLGDYVDAPLILDKAIEKDVFRLIDELALEHRVDKMLFQVDPLETDRFNYNFLQEYGYLDTSILNYVVDLTVPDIYKQCRENHRRNIKRILNDAAYSIFTIDSSNPSYESHEEYRELHRRCSGRVTRPKETFDLQFKKLIDGQAALFGLKYKEKDIAYVYFEHNGNVAAYCSAADDPEYDRLPLYHALIYSALEYYKNKGIRLVDMEQPSTPSAQYDSLPDQKQLQIAHFKSGFPGTFVQNFRGVKYFSADQFERDNAAFARDYISLIQANSTNS